MIIPNQLYLGSLFDGIGGFPLAGVRNGIIPLWASEIESGPISITKRHFPEMAHLGDIIKINGEHILSVDIITFGSPCQDLSIAGGRIGLSGERSGLFMEAVRLIKEMRKATNGKNPAVIIWENVPGAFSSNNGEDFKIVIKEIASIGWGGENFSIPKPSGGWPSRGAVVGNSFSLAWRVLDAQYWGVPQRRRRIFLVADFAGRRAGEILFKSEGLPWCYSQGESTGKGITAKSETCTRSTDDVCYDARGNGNGMIANSMTGDHNSRISDYCTLVFNMKSLGDYTQNSLFSTIAMRDYKSARDLIISNRFVRRLTPLECERLQGFPDEWTAFGYDGKRMSDSVRYKVLGNSVAIPCVEFIMKRTASVMRKPAYTAGDE
jgi:DNA (cytosine-5)-methyltransferase 1